MRQAWAQAPGAQKLAAAANPAYVVMDKPTAYKDATTYNNFYEFGTDKSDPAQNAGTPEDAAVDGRHRRRGQEAA